MKIRRFLSVFFVFVLVCAGWAVPASAEETPPAAVEDPAVLAQSALLVDLRTGSVAYAKNEHQELYPASLTKIMTALLTLEAVDGGRLAMDQQITATATAMTGLAADGSSAGIKAGETMTVQELLYCMLVVSANEACNILAEAVSGTVDGFVAAMNRRAAELGCENTHYVNTTGLHDPQHYTSAWDLYLISREAVKHPDFMAICNTADVVVPATNLSPERSLHTTNYLLSNWRASGYRYSNARGIKTGSTSQAGHCLVSTASQGSLSFLSVVMGAEAVQLDTGKTQVQSFSETKRLFEWGFDNFSYETVATTDEVVREVEVALSRKVNYVTVHPAEEIETLLPRDLAPEDLDRRITLQEPVDAPIQEGQVLGSMELSHGGTVYATVDLLALNGVEASRLLIFWRDVQTFFQKTAVRVAAVVLAVLIVALVVWKLTVGSRRYRYGHSVSRRSGGYHGRRRR